MSLTKYTSVEVLDVVAEVPANVGAARLSRIRRAAHRHEFQFEPRPGYIYVRSRAISSRCNDNFDEFPASEIKQAYRTFIGKPVFVNHKNDNHRRARGVIIDAALHEDINPDNTPDTWAEVLMEVDAVKFPMLAKAVKAGDIARTSMGTDVAYSVCTACGNKAETPADYCAHIPKMKGMQYRRTLASGQTETVLIAERCYGLRFFENSLLVEDPADPTAFVLGVVDGDGTTTAAKEASVEAEVVEDAPDFAPFSAKTAARETRTDQRQETHVATPDFLCEDCGTGVARRDAFLRGGLADGSDQWAQKGWCRGCAEKRGWIHDGRVASLPKASSMCSECNPGHGLPATLCAPHGYMAKMRTQWGDQAPQGTFFSDRYFASRKTAATWMDSYYADEGTQDIEYEGVGEARVFPLFDGNPLTETGKWGWDVVLYDDPVKRPYGEESSRDAAKAKAEEVLRGGQQVLGHQHTAYGETKAPAQVDTMRAENCPVCGDDEAFNGERCSVCGYQQPPSQFRDPDLSKAKQQDLRQDQQDQQGIEGDPVGDALAEPGDDLECTNCGEVFSAEGDAEEANPAKGPGDAVDPEHPDDAAPEDPSNLPADGDRADEQDPAAVDPPERDEAADADHEPEPKHEPKDDDEPDDLSDLEDADDADLGLDDEDEDPEEIPGADQGASEDEADTDLDDTDDEAADLSDLPIAANMTCPVCGQGTLVPKGASASGAEEPNLNEVGTSPASVEGVK